MVANSQTIEGISMISTFNEIGENKQRAFLDKQERPIIVGGRFGLGSKDPVPSHIAAVFNNLALDKTKNGLEIDETTDKNLRYVGASPKNYLKFNDEIWRIIGVFNNITTIDKQENEKTESLVKIVRND